MKSRESAQKNIHARRITQACEWDEGGNPITGELSDAELSSAEYEDVHRQIVQILKV